MSYGLRRGIVEEVVSATSYKVRIINYDSGVGDPTKTLTSDLAEASVVAQPGTNVVYNIGDRVYLGFNKDELSDPVIIGSMLTEAHPTDGNQITMPAVSNALDDIKSSIEEMKVDQYYTHTKYSNDGGKTFTSLYEYNYAEEKLEDQVYYVTDKDVVIDPTSKTVYWTIIDSESFESADDFSIYTTIRVGHYDNQGTFIEEESRTFNEPIFDIPFTMQTYEVSFLDYKISKVPDFENYYIVCTTDKNTIGSVQGNYMGICTTTSPEPPDDPSYYNWTSFKTTIEDIVSSASTDLEKRVKRNEDNLYGSDDGSIVGLLDGITVTEEQIDIHGLYNKTVSFNTNKSIYIDNKNNGYVAQSYWHTTPNANSSFIETYNSNGHLTLYIKENN